MERMTNIRGNSPIVKEKMNIKLNPIMKKDLRVLSRSMKIAWGLFIYEAVLLIVFLFAIWVIFEEMGGYGYSSDYQAFISLFPLISAIEFFIIALLMPILTATAVSGEKERQTFDILLTTVMTPRAIIRGKVASAVIRVMVFMIASIPLMALSFTLGGLSWVNLFITMIAFLIFAILTGSFGIFASTLTQKSITAIILTYVFYFVFANLTFVPTLIISVAHALSGSSAATSILMMFNPVAAIIQMFMLMLGADDLFGTSSYSFIKGWVWVALSGVAMIGFSVLFQELAARRIDPLLGYVKDKKKNQQKGVSIRVQTPAQPQVPAGWVPGQDNDATVSNAQTAQQPIAAEQNSIAPMQQSIAPEQSSIAPTQQPIAPEQSSIAPTQQPIAPEQSSIAPTQQPIAPEQRSIAPTQQPIAPEQSSITSISQATQPAAQESIPEAPTNAGEQNNG